LLSIDGGVKRPAANRTTAGWPIRPLRDPPIPRATSRLVAALVVIHFPIGFIVALQLATVVAVSIGAATAERASAATLDAPNYSERITTAARCRTAVSAARSAVKRGAAVVVVVVVTRARRRVGTVVAVASVCCVVASRRG
jgi:hypothetical protein